MDGRRRMVVLVMREEGGREEGEEEGEEWAVE